MEGGREGGERRNQTSVPPPHPNGKKGVRDLDLATQNPLLLTKPGSPPWGTMGLPPPVRFFFYGKGGRAQGKADIIGVHLPRREQSNNQEDSKNQVLNVLLAGHLLTLMSPS